MDRCLRPNYVRSEGCLQVFQRRIPGCDLVPRARKIMEAKALERRVMIPEPPGMDPIGWPSAQGEYFDRQASQTLWVCVEEVCVEHPIRFRVDLEI